MPTRHHRNPGAPVCGTVRVNWRSRGDVNFNPFPEPLEIDHRLAGHITGKEEGATFRHGIAAQPDQGDGLMRDRHAVDAALLGVGGLLGPDLQIEVKLIEGGRAGLAAAGAGQHAEADYPGGTLIGIGAEGVGKALDFLKGEEPLAGGFGAFAETGCGIVGAHFPRNS